MTEPKAYSVIAGAITKDMNPSPPTLAAYRKTLEVVGLVTEAVAYLDRLQRDLIFLKDGKFPVPIRFEAENLMRLFVADADELMRSFADETHRDQKLAILAETVLQLVTAQPPGGRFRSQLANLSSLTDEVRKATSVELLVREGARRP